MISINPSGDDVLPLLYEAIYDVREGDDIDDGGGDDSDDDWHD